MKPSQLFACSFVLVAHSVVAATLHVEIDGRAVPPFATRGTAATTVQAAIDSAADGDTVLVGRGGFTGDVDFRGKRITVRGRGPESVLIGTGRGPVVRFATGEDRLSVLDSVQITNGRADDGGGVFVSNASPSVQRVVFFANLADGAGSGIYVGGRAANPVIRNNIFAYNDDSSPAVTDAHQLFVDSGSRAVIVNNTIVRGNGNGILIQGSPNPSVVRNNVIAWNGSRLRSGTIIGRGICDFSGSARIQNNLFFENSRSAVLTGTFQDFQLIADAETVVDEKRFRRNLDGNPRFQRVLAESTPPRLDVGRLQFRASSPVRNRGAAERRFRDVNGSRNDIGHSGGPLGWR